MCLLSVCEFINRALGLILNSAMVGLKINRCLSAAFHVALLFIYLGALRYFCGEMREKVERARSEAASGGAPPSH